MIRLLPLLLTVTASFALPQGQLRFNLSGKTYVTQHAVAMLQAKGNTTRLMIAVKDIDQKFLLVLTADVAKGDEEKPLHLTTENSALGINLRTPQGVLAVLPQIQMAKATADTYVERVDVDTGEWEDDTDAAMSTDRRYHGQGPKKRRKLRTEYRRVKPRWQQLTREERIRSGEGIIANRAFQDTYFTLSLTPVKEAGRVTAYHGSFSGTGRFSRSFSGAEIRPIENGVFNVKVEYAQ